MRYIQLLSSVLVLCFVLTVSAYAAEPATVDPPANIPEDVPEWALRPALEPGEEPTDETDTGTADDSASERGYTTIYNSDGPIRYTDDPALLAERQQKAYAWTVKEAAVLDGIAAALAKELRR